MKSALYAELVSYLEGLTVTQGQGLGETLDLLRWQRRFLRGAFGDGAYTSALSLARGNGKTTLCAALGAAAMNGPLRAQRGETVIVASSFTQARIAFASALAFMGDLPRSEWRVTDNMQRAEVRHIPTGAALKCLASDPKRAHGIAPKLILADEPAQWPRTTAETMRGVLETSLGKIPGARMIALGTRPAGQHWFQRWIDGAGLGNERIPHSMPCRSLSVSFAPNLDGQDSMIP